MRRTRFASAALALTLLLGCRAETQPAREQTVSAPSPAGLGVLPLTISSGQRTHTFSVELAATEEQQAQGLMFREALAPDAGMIFPFPVPRPASFWMKNTLIPLDMIFIRPDGTIARIAANTIPHSLDPVGVEEPVAAVLEIAGGRAAELGIGEGDKVSWPGGPSG